MGHEDEFAKMIRDHERMRDKVEIWKKLVKDADSSQLALLRPWSAAALFPKLATPRRGCGKPANTQCDWEA